MSDKSNSMAKKTAELMNALVEKPSAEMNDDRKQTEILAYIAVTISGIADILVAMCGEDDED